MIYCKLMKFQILAPQADSALPSHTDTDLTFFSVFFFSSYSSGDENRPSLSPGPGQSDELSTIFTVSYEAFDVSSFDS